ncbi:uncharacterized protein PAC_19492 [Phialocephala subalpina]|uniref:Uncharacterized protein n=1 Tax=Phialocephala subalpina TaxID=576137 RepID=A0A1L7XWZ8_9HELO|nr:uncharacterized protein PAC_19492 [Phialocephala subalpina]
MSQYSKAVDDFAIGIDLGSSKTSVGIFRNGRVEMIPDEGENAIPSCVAFTDHTVLVGQAARSQAISNPRDTIADPVRWLGWSLKDIDLQRKLALLPFDIVSARTEALIKVRYRKQDICLRPLEIVAVILAHVKRIAENYLQGKVSGAVITFSSGMSLSQREMVKAAASVANLQLWAMLSDSTACIIAHEYITSSIGSQKDRTVMAINVGSARTDITLAGIDGDYIDERAVADHTDDLGGDFFVRRVVNHIAKATPRLAALNTFDNPRVLRQLQAACKTAMHDLSFRTSTTIHLNSFLGGRDLDVPISRGDFEEICSDLPKLLLDRVQRALADADLDKSRIDEVILAGGASRIPMVQVAVSDFFNGKPFSKLSNVDEAATYGASVFASLFSLKPEARLDRMKCLLLLDVYPHSLSVAAEGNGVVERVVVRNTVVPLRKSHLLSNVENNQKWFTFALYEGERRRPKDNQLVGTISLPITPAPKDQTSVIIEIHVNGRHGETLKVTAQERGSRIPYEMKFIWAQQTSEEEISRMIESARRFEHDLLEQECIKARNALEKYVQGAREFIEHIDRHPSYRPAKALLQSTTTWIKETDAETRQYQAQLENMRAFFGKLLDLGDDM